MHIINKDHKLLKKVALAALLMFGSHASAQNLGLVSGTDFTPKSDEGKPFYSWSDVEKGNIGFQGVIKPQVKINVPLCESINFNEESSDFIDGRYYCITNNPCKIDSFRFYDTKEAEWGLLLPKSSGVLATMTVEGLNPNSDYRVEVDYQLVADYSVKFGVGYRGLQYNEQTKTVIFTIDPHITFNVNPSIYSITSGADFGFSALRKEAGARSTAVILNQKVGEAVDANGKLTLNIVGKSQTEAFFITAVRIYAEIAPKTKGVSEVCVGGEKAIIKADREYPGAKFQWYKDGKALPGETRSSTVHTSGTEQGLHEYYYEITLDDGFRFKSKPFEVKDILCYQSDDGTPLSRKIIYKQDFGTFTSDKGDEFYVWDYSDISHPVKKYYKTNTPFITNLPQMGIPAPEGAASGSCMEDEGHSVIAWITDAQEGSKIGWAAQIGGTGEYWGPDRKNGPFFPDHTDQLEGTGKYGAALFVNAIGGDHSKMPLIVYKDTLTNLCEGLSYTIKCYINNYSDGRNPVEIQIKAYDSEHFGDPNYGGESKREIRYATEGSDWREVSLDVPRIESGSLTFEILNYTSNADNQGDDLIIDDIIVYASSTPKVDLYFDLNTYQTDTTSCGVIDIYADESVMLKNYYGSNLHYLYQYTTGDPESITCDWKNLNSKITTKTSFTVEEAYALAAKSDKSQIYFRVVAGDKNVLENLSYFNANDPCSNYSVSNVISMTIDCPTCTQPASKIKIVADKAIDKIKLKAKDIVPLCFGESVTLSQEKDITPDEADLEGSHFEGFAIKWFESEIPGSMVDAETILNDKISNKVVKFDDHSLEGITMRVLLYAVDAMYPDGQCYTADTIYVRFNETPNAEFSTAKAAFEEGKGKGKVDLTLTNGNATDYTIKWWNSADTTGTAIGENHDAAFFEGLKTTDSGIYTYQLVDNSTLCVGETHNYEIIVSPATAIENIAADEDEIINVYTVSGSLIKENVKRSEALNGLANGAYVIGGQKVVVNK